MKTVIDKNETELERMKRESLEWLNKHPTAPSFIRVAISAFPELKSQIEQEDKTACHCGGYPDCIYNLPEPVRVEMEKNILSGMGYLNECIAKATPGLSRIKDVDKHMDEIRGVEPTVKEQSNAYYNRDKLLERNVEKPSQLAMEQNGIDTVEQRTINILLDDTFSGHPSRESDYQIRNAIKFLAKQIDVIHFKRIKSK